MQKIAIVILADTTPADGLGRVVNGMMIPAHRELVIVRPGYWVRTESMFHPVP